MRNLQHSSTEVETFRYINWLLTNYQSVTIIYQTDYLTYFEIPSSLRDVPGETSRQSNVGVSVDENFHVQHIEDVFVMEGL